MHSSNLDILRAQRRHVLSRESMKASEKGICLSGRPRCRPDQNEMIGRAIAGILDGYVQADITLIRIDQGTTISLYLPVHEHAPVSATDSLLKTEAPSLQGQGKTILVIDDEPSVRMLIAEVLADAGFAAIEAADGPSALTIIESNARIDLLITDVGLPGGLNGRQIADAARVQRPGLKVLFVTGYAENVASQGSQMDAGMSLITKPFEIATLAQKIREVLVD